MHTCFHMKYRIFNFDPRWNLNGHKEKREGNIRTCETQSMAGEIKRQGPHQLATNSTRTGRSELSTRSENWLSFISVTPHVITDFLRNEEEEPDPDPIIFLRRLSNTFSGEGVKQLVLRKLQVKPIMRTGVNGRTGKMDGFETSVSMVEREESQRVQSVSRSRERMACWWERGEVIWCEQRPQHSRPLKCNVPFALCSYYPYPHGLTSLCRH